MVLIKLFEGFAGSVWQAAFEREAVIFPACRENHSLQWAWSLVSTSTALHYSGEIAIVTSAHALSNSIYESFIFVSTKSSVSGFWQIGRRLSWHISIVVFWYEGKHSWLCFPFCKLFIEFFFLIKSWCCCPGPTYTNHSLGLRHISLLQEIPPFLLCSPFDRLDYKAPIITKRKKGHEHHCDRCSLQSLCIWVSYFFHIWWQKPGASLLSAGYRVAHSYSGLNSK